ncbi:CBL-interacting serine/threonine-protein kinase 8 [Senna tora]|uniref:non-specific serine/threonine protein kinase n=1 Tax=Senna tora TaxID=362788 RepID=A0A834WPQ1_9FABA|nr:CBL-interacting serine/threonine-protein kinase 8 [Senna tora]
MVVRKVGKYEIGRTIGEGTFAKVKFAQNTETGESVAMKVLDRSTIIKHKMVDQIKREISIMKLVRHPYVVRLHEACDLFWTLDLSPLFFFPFSFLRYERFENENKICVQVHHGRISESESRRYFQQLIDGVDFCHSKGVYHRDLKPENLLLDSQGNIKISDFGLSAFPEQGVSILRTTCGTPNYVAPEVLNHKGYDGALADVWSCGVILYVLLAGYLPFDELDLTTLYSCMLIYLLSQNSVVNGTEFGSGLGTRKIHRADFSCPPWFPVGAKSLIQRILDPNPATSPSHHSFCVHAHTQRITIEQMRSDEWFKKEYVPVSLVEHEDVNLDDVNAAFDDAEDQADNQHSENEDMGPLMLNAFDLIILSQGLNLATLFDRGKDSMNYQTRFITQKPAKVVLSSMEVVAQSMGFKTHIRNYKMRVEGTSADKTYYFSVMVEIFEVAPTFFMVDIQKAAGDVGEYLKHVFAEPVISREEKTERERLPMRMPPGTMADTSPGTNLLLTCHDCQLSRIGAMTTIDNERDPDNDCTLTVKSKACDQTTVLI